MKGLYLVTDRVLCDRRSLADVILQAIRGGVSCVQLREKDLSTRVFVEEAKRIKHLLSSFGVPLIINDRMDVALASEADGIHIGQEDMPYEVVRNFLGPKAIIGMSVETWSDVEKAEALNISYLGVSPVFETPTKTNTKGSWGLDGLARIRAYSHHPMVAIGGINASNAAAVMEAGADAIAVVSAICAASNPFRAARELVEIIQSARKKGIVDEG